MKKRPEEELGEEFIDDEEFVDDEELLDDDFDDDDFLDDEEDIDDEPKKKGKKVDKKKGKKKSKLSKGAKIGIIIPSVLVGIAAIVLVVVFVVLPLLVPQATVSSEFQELLSVNGYQNYDASQSVGFMSTASSKKLVTVKEMMDATGYTTKDTAEFAAALYSLAIYNYANVVGSGWYCYTDSNVNAREVTATIAGMTLPFEKFEVGVRAAYCLGYEEAKNTKNAQQIKEKQNNYFSETISGVTLLDIAGLPSSLTGTVKGLFGYNCIQFLYDGTYAYKRAKNGGAEFYGKDYEEGYKYLMGAYNEKLFSSKGYKANAKDPESGYPEMTYFAADYSADYSEAKSLDYTEKPEDVIQRDSAWGKLDTKYEYAYTLKPYEDTYTYYCGTYGTGWATYNFSKEFIDGSKTTIEYDKKNHVYTINMVVKEDKVDDACMFAKGSLTKDTKDYIQLQNAKYTLSKNMIQIYENGLIKYWEREETVNSEEKAKLTIMPGECKKGGGTTNHTYMAFSYSPIDYSPIALAARYLPEISSKVKIDSKWPTLDSYDPKGEDYSSLK